MISAVTPLVHWIDYWSSNNLLVSWAIYIKKVYMASLQEIIETNEFAALSKNDKQRAVLNYGELAQADTRHTSKLVGLNHDLGSNLNYVAEGAAEMKSAYLDTRNKLASGELSKEEAAKSWLLTEENLVAKQRDARNAYYENLSLQREKLALESSQKSFGNIFFNVMSNHLLRSDTDEHQGREASIEGIEKKIGDSGLSDEDISTIGADAFAMGESDDVALLSNGSLVIANRDNLIKGLDPFVDAVNASGATSEEKERVLGSLQEEQEATTEELWDLLTDGLHVVTDSKGEPQYSSSEGLRGSLEAATAGVFGVEKDIISGAPTTMQKRIDAKHTDFTHEQKLRVLQDYLEATKSDGVGGVINTGLKGAMSGALGVGRNAMVIADLAGITGMENLEAKNEFFKKAQEGTARLEGIQNRSTFDKVLGAASEQLPFFGVMRLAGSGAKRLPQPVG